MTITFSGAAGNIDKVGGMSEATEYVDACGLISELLGLTKCNESKKGTLQLNFGTPQNLQRSQK